MVTYGTISFFVIAGYAQGGSESIPCFAVAIIVALYEYMSSLRTDGLKGRILKTARYGFGMLYWLLLAAILVPK